MPTVEARVEKIGVVACSGCQYSISETTSCRSYDLAAGKGLLSALPGIVSSLCWSSAIIAGAQVWRDHVLKKAGHARHIVSGQRAGTGVGLGVGVEVEERSPGLVRPPG